MRLNYWLKNGQFLATARNQTADQKYCNMLENEFNSSEDEIEPYAETENLRTSEVSIECISSFQS